DDAGTDNDDAGLGGDGSHGRLLSEGFFALHCCLSSNWVRDAELCTMIVPLRDGRVKGSSQCSRQPSLAEMSAAADISRSRAERALTSVKRKLGPEAAAWASASPRAWRRGDGREGS